MSLDKELHNNLAQLRTTDAEWLSYNFCITDEETKEEIELINKGK